MTTHAALASDLTRLIQALDGYKIYIGCLVWAGMIVCAHFGIQLPGVTPDPNADWLSQLLAVYMVAAGRSTVNKLIPGGNQ